jgi:hypothetical protein
LSCQNHRYAEEPSTAVHAPRGAPLPSILTELLRVIPIAIHGGPIFLFELTMGVWVVAKGLPPSV